MKLGIISDTHGSVDDFSEAMEVLEDCEKIIHLGDVLYHGPRNGLPESYDPKTIAEGLSKSDKFIYIKGNCDSEVDEMVIGQNLSEKERIVEIDDYRFYLVHGHIGTEEDLIRKAIDLNADVLLYGHTHVKKLEHSGGVLVCNPGSTTFPKDAKKSLAYYEDGKISLYNLESHEEITTVCIEDDCEEL